MRLRWIVAALVLAVAAQVGSRTVAAQSASSPDWVQLQDETLRHFQALLRLDTQNPPGNEYLVTDYVRSVLEREGIAVETYALDPKRPNLVARIKGTGRKRPILYMGHSDVVTVDPKKWTFPPFSAQRDAGYIYGRGSLDDKPHVVAGMMALLTLKRSGTRLDRDVILLVESDEEGTSGPGVDFMTKQHADAIQSEFCLAEGGSVARVNGKVSYASVQAAEKQQKTIELVANGPSGHASRPLQGNAVVNLAAAVAAAGRWRTPVRLNDTTRQFFSKIAEVSPPDAAARYRAVLDPTSPAGRAADDYMLANEPNYASMLRTSISPTIINGGYRFNVIPSEAQATLDVRWLPDEDQQQFLAALRQVINDPAVTVRFSADTGNLGGGPRPSRLDSEAFRVVQSAIARNYDTVTVPTMSTGFMDMTFVRALGTDCYGIGPAVDVEDGPKGFGAHSDQERILEAELHRFVRLSYEIVYDLARATN